MTTPAMTIRVFGVYLLALSAVLLLVPNPFLAVFGMAPTTDVWIRVVGMLVAFLGYYYLRASASGLSEFYAWTVGGRLSVLLFFGAFVALSLAPPALLVFGLIDAAGAAWTWHAIRSAPARA